MSKMEFEVEYFDNKYRISVNIASYEVLSEHLKSVLGKYYKWFEKGEFRVGMDVLTLIYMGSFYIEEVKTKVDNSNNNKYEITVVTNEYGNVLLSGLLRDVVIDRGLIGHEIDFNEFAKEVKDYCKTIMKEYNKVLSIRGCDKLDAFLLSIPYPIRCSVDATSFDFIKKVVSNCPSLRFGVSLVEVAYDKYQGGQVD